jgi:hypothetical protein
VIGQRRRSARPPGPRATARSGVAAAAAPALALAAGLSGTGSAQPAPAAPGGVAEPAANLPDPPLAPPAPPMLRAPGSATHTVEPPAPPPPDPLADVETRPGGGYWLRVATPAEAPLDPAATRAVEAIGRRLAEAAEGGRVTVLAQVAARPETTDVSTQRRLALSRALAVKAALVAGGLDPTRIDLRPLGRTAEGLDAVDILPPGARQQQAAAATTNLGGTPAR